MMQIAPDAGVRSAGGDATALLAAMACDFHAEWRRRFNRPGVAPCARLEGSRLLLRLEQAFTSDELDLARQEAGPAAVRRSLEGLLDDLYPWLAVEVEARLHCYVAESRVLMNLADASVAYEVALRDRPRFSLPAVASSCDPT